jgi:hypothetical protein
MNAPAILANRLRGLVATLGLCLCGLSSSPATAQALSPMKDFIHSSTDRFTVDVRVINPYPDSQRSQIIVRDTSMQPIKDAFITANNFVMSAGQVRAVSVQVSFMPKSRTRIIYICHSILPQYAGVGTSYRGEVCGKFSAYRSA